MAEYCLSCHIAYCNSGMLGAVCCGKRYWRPDPACSPCDSKQAWGKVHEGSFGGFSLYDSGHIDRVLYLHSKRDPACCIVFAVEAGDEGDYACVDSDGGDSDADIGADPSAMVRICYEGADYCGDLSGGPHYMSEYFEGLHKGWDGEAGVVPLNGCRTV